jgi:nucleoside-diphosphate-sugar epimerase
VMARCFAFVGPYLPWNTHFAIGNFLKDAVQGVDLQIQGDGTPYRSYLFSMDWVVWMVRTLMVGQVGAVYNIGSDQAYSIRELAETVLKVARQEGFLVKGIQVAKKADPLVKPARYVPDVSLAKQTLGLKENYPLEDSIQETLRWYKIKRN